MPRYDPNPEPVQRIKDLPDLIAYLRDELGWPIAPETVIGDLIFSSSAPPPITAAYPLAFENIELPELPGR